MFWPLLVVAMLAGAACEPSDDNVGDVPGGGASTSMSAGLTVELDLAASVELGRPNEVVVRISNDGARSRSAPVEVALVGPDAEPVTFAAATLFVPFGETVSEGWPVTTSRWFPEPGTYEVRVTLSGDASDVAPVRRTFVVAPSDRVLPRFIDVTAEAGVVTDIPAPECGQFANGAAWADVDGDGWQDLLVTRIGEPVRLFVNRRDGTFDDESEQRGVDVRDVNGAAFADFDNDGDADLVLVGDGPDRLLVNDGDGNFDDASSAAGLSRRPGERGMSAAWGDYDGDGLLDLYVTNYMECSGPWETTGDVLTNVAYHPDVLYHNEGDGTFRDVTADVLAPDENGAGFTAAWGDYDGDGLLDLFVGNDFVGLSPDHNRLWRNGGPEVGWRFEDVSLDSGAGLYMNTMGIGLADVDRDGDVDVALSNIGGNRFLRGNGDGTFVEETRTGIERPRQGVEHPSVTWTSAFYDLDLDGWEDLLMTAGNLPQGPEVPVGEQPDMVFVNDGSGDRFLDVSSATGIDHPGDSKGAAFADFDRDGRIDVVVIDQSGGLRLYRNDTPRSGRHWLLVDLVGTVSNRDACGAHITVVVSGEMLRRTVLCGSGGTGSAHQHQVHVGLGTATTVDRVQVRWPSGLEQVVESPPVDDVLTIVEDRG